jgi:hypothetical protein
MAIFDEIRSAASAVSRAARSVRIEGEKISGYAQSLPAPDALRPALDPRHHYLGAPAETVAFVVTLDAINFGSGYFPHLRKLEGLSGYFTVAAWLTDRFRREGPFDAAELSRLTADDCARLFHQTLDAPPVEELMGLFAQALRDLGGYLTASFDGSFTALIDAAGRSAERLVELLAAMPFFQDVHFYKRAQLTAADLSLALNGEGWGQFTDLDRLTIFADNLVPHVLRVDGILTYDSPLAQRIDAGELLTAGSEEEIEIRACAIHAVELLVEDLRRAGRPTRALDLDYLLWNRGQQPYYKALPRHRARSVFY